MYRFKLFNLGFLTGLFNKQQLIQCIKEGANGGFKMIRKEFTLEPRRVLLFLSAPSFGIIFKKDEANPEPKYEWSIGQYKTRFFTKTVSTSAITKELSSFGNNGYELYFAMKYPCRFLFLFPREAYFFIFRKLADAENPARKYHVEQTAYRLFSKTIDPNVYTNDLNSIGRSSKLLITFRDEKRQLGLFKQPTVVSIWEKK